MTSDHWAVRPPHALALALAASLLASGCRSAAGPGTPAFEPVLTTAVVTPTGLYTEPGAAVNPKAVDDLLAAYQVPASTVYSADGLKTWTTAPLPEGVHWPVSGDPSVEFDADGHAYALYIAFDPPENYDTLGAKPHRNGIFVNRSDDGGRTWRPQPTTVIAQPEQPGIPFEDKPMMGVDRTATARRGRVYVAWTEFRRTESVILFARSEDGGISFSTPLVISDRAGSPRDNVGAAEGTDIAVGPDGTVYVVWSDSTGILLDRSTDGGVTFGADRHIETTGDIVFPIPNVFRANGYPSIGVDPRSGRLYVLWVDRRPGTATLFLTTSDDQGTTWTVPRRIATGDGNRFFAWLAVDPMTGIVAVGYYRQLPDNLLSYYLAWSTDGGANFFQRVWSTAPFDPGGRFIGDYTTIDVYDGVALAAWTEVPTGGGGPVDGSTIVMGRAFLTPR